MHRDKTQVALSAALKNLEDSIKSLSHGNDETAVSNSLWSASAEAEYAVFLLSLMHGDKSETAPWKHGSTPKKPIDLEGTLASARQLLENAKLKVEAGDLEKGYEEAWAARNLLLKAQELLEKKRKEAKK